MSETITLNRADLKDSMLIISNLAGNARELSIHASVKEGGMTHADHQKIEELLMRINTHANNYYAYLTTH